MKPFYETKTMLVRLAEERDATRIREIYDKELYAGWDADYLTEGAMLMTPKEFEESIREAMDADLRLCVTYVLEEKGSVTGFATTYASYDRVEIGSVAATISGPGKKSHTRRHFRQMLLIKVIARVARAEGFEVWHTSWMSPWVFYPIGFDEASSGSNTYVLRSESGDERLKESLTGEITLPDERIYVTPEKYREVAQNLRAEKLKKWDNFLKSPLVQGLP